jgi:fatty-acid desaturase
MIVAIGIVLIVIAGATVIVVSYHRLLTHRSDAAAMAAYRQLAEQTAAGQEQLHQRLDAIDTRIAAMESLLREVG